MLETLYKKGYLNYEHLILDYGKALGLNAEEGFILIQILKNYLVTQTISISNIVEQLLITPSRLDKVVASLMERGYYEVYLSYDNGKGMECISFAPLFEKIEMLIAQKTDMDMYDIEKANQYLTAKLNRVLTASELEILQGLMVEDRYTYDQIAMAIDAILSSNRVLSMRTLTSTLANKRYDVKPTKEAPAAFKDFVKRI